MAQMMAVDALSHKRDIKAIECVKNILNSMINVLVLHNITSYLLRQFGIQHYTTGEIHMQTSYVCWNEKEIADIIISMDRYLHAE